MRTAATRRLDEAELIALCERGVQEALARGADDAEVAAAFSDGVVVSFENNDIGLASAEDELVLGVRVFRDGRTGFASTNAASTLAETVDDALAIAATSVRDAALGLPDPRPVTTVSGLHDPAVAALGVADVTELGARFLDGIRAADARASVDSGTVSATASLRAVASSRGIAVAERGTRIGGHAFGMAVEGDRPGSFVSENRQARVRAGFEEQIDEAARRFVDKALGALHPTKGISYRGAVIFTPEAVAQVLLGNLLAMTSASALRQGKTPYAGKLGERIAAPGFSLRDDGTLAGGVGSSSFDREGLPHRPLALVEDGVFGAVMYDAYEARAAGRDDGSTGHAAGSPAAEPSVGPTNLVLAPGSTPRERLYADAGRAILVTRFSGSTNTVTGEFSGVVKAGFLLEPGGSRRAVAETLISGNLVELFRNVVGLSAETERVSGVWTLPWVLCDGVSVTAG